MKTRTPLIATIIVAALMAGFALWAASLAPAGMELPTHWNAAGEVDDTMPALQALLLPAGLALFVGPLFSIIPALEPLQNRLEGSAPLLRTAWLGTLALMIALQGFIAAPIFGFEPGVGAILVPVGILLILLGNMLPKSRPGFFVGIRTPWTITDADNWVATHRLGGKLFMAAGAAIVLAGVLDLSPAIRTIVMLGAIFAAAAIPFIHSWWFWHRNRRSENGA